MGDEFAVAGAWALLVALLIVWRRRPMLRWFGIGTSPTSGKRWHRDQARDDANADAPSAEQLYFDAAQRQLETQVSSSTILDTKAMNCITVGSTVLPLTFGLLALARRPAGNVEVTPLPGITIVLFSLAVLAYLGVLVLAVRGLNYRALEYRPEIPTLQMYVRTLDAGAVRRWIAEEYGASIAANGPMLVVKARTIGAATWALFVETLLISLAGATALLL